jgi:hypothetical protein
LPCRLRRLRRLRQLRAFVVERGVVVVAREAVLLVRRLGTTVRPRAQRGRWQRGPEAAAAAAKRGSSAKRPAATDLDALLLGGGGSEAHVRGGDVGLERAAARRL